MCHLLGYELFIDARILELEKKVNSFLMGVGLKHGQAIVALICKSGALSIHMLFQKCDWKTFLEQKDQPFHQRGLQVPLGAHLVISDVSHIFSAWQEWVSSEIRLHGREAFHVAREEL